MIVETPPPSGSPRWGNNTKLIVGLTAVALLAALMVSFRQVIGPVLLAFILAYLIQPIAAALSRATHLHWRAAVNIVYVLVIVVVATVVAIGGYALIQQSQALIAFLDRFVSDLPSTVEQLSGQQFQIGPFRFDLSRLDLQAGVQQLLSMVQPIVGQAGTLVGRFATGAANTLGWTLFIMLVSYFLLSESGQVRDDLLHISIPGYDADSRRLVRELTVIWDSFLRGQLLISLLIVISYYILLTILGTRLSMAIALMAGVAAFIPYIGSFITWAVTAIIAYFQSSNYFGLDSMTYTIVVVVACLILNQVFDNYVTPRMMGRALGVHPAGVLIAAIVATNLIGFAGLMLAAPALASVTLVGRYIGRKMLDLDPWPPVQSAPRELVPIWTRISRRIQALWRWLRRQVSHLP